jgi:TRAP-type C4-dicarboxylate transport system substrate-binding protein
MKAFLAAVLLLWAAAGSAAAQEQTIKFGVIAPDGSPWYNILRDMAESWKASTGGKIQFKIYPGGVAGDEPDMVRKMRIGQLHAAALTSAGLAEIAPEITALQLPMLFRDYEEFDAVLARVAPRLEQILLEKGYRVLNWGDAGWVTFYARNPVVSMADLRKEKLFVWATASSDVGVWKDAGVQAVPLATTEIHVALKSGLVTAIQATPLAALSFQWFGSAQNMADLKWTPLVGATVMTAKKWDALPSGVKPALLKSAQETGERLRKETRKLGDDAIEVMKKHGLVVHPVPPDVVKDWERIAVDAYPKFVGSKIPPAFFQEVLKIRDEVRAGKQ